MKTTSSIIAAVLTIAGIFGTASVASADHGHVENLAHRLDGQIRQLATHLRANYRHTNQYRHLSIDTGIMLRLSSHLHGVAHRGGSLTHMSHDVKELHEQFHHVELLINQIEYAAAHGYGHLHGNTRYVRRMIARIDQTLTHLDEDLESMLHPVVHHHEYGHGHGGHGYGRRHIDIPISGGPTLHLGGGRFSFSFGH